RPSSATRPGGRGTRTGRRRHPPLPHRSPAVAGTPRCRIRPVAATDTGVTRRRLPGRTARQTPYFVPPQHAGPDTAVSATPDPGPNPTRVTPLHPGRPVASAARRGPVRPP